MKHFTVREMLSVRWREGEEEGRLGVVEVEMGGKQEQVLNNIAVGARDHDV